MAFNKANGKQIKDGIITNAHVATTAAIAESKLAIDWNAHGIAILQSKLIVDYVQVSDSAVASGGTNLLATSSISAPPAAADTERGAITQTGKNKVILRDSVTGDPIISPFDTEVYGRLSHNGTDYVVAFYALNASAVETMYTFPNAATIDYQFPQRFDLSTVSETFAANEKFVDGASDVSSRLDLEQIIKDAFGPDYTLDQDGLADLTMSLAEQILQETSGVTNTTIRAKTIIDETIVARGGFATVNDRLAQMEENVSNGAGSISSLQAEVAAGRGTELSLDARFDTIEAKDVAQDGRLDNIDLKNATQDGRLTTVEAEVDTLVADLKSTDAAKGASMVGVANRVQFPTQLTVEDALTNLESRTQTTEARGTEVVNARGSSKFGAFSVLDDRLDNTDTVLYNVKVEVEDARNSAFKAKNFLKVDDRLEEIESDHSGFVNSQNTANTGFDDRLDGIETLNSTYADRLTGLEAIDHQHFAEDKQVLAADPLINTSRYDFVSGTFVAGNKSLQVYYNGMLQMVGVHYTEITNVGSEGIAVSFSPDLIAQNDVLQFRWTK